VKTGDWKKTKWKDEFGTTIATIHEVLSMLESEPIVPIKTDKLKHFLSNIELESHRIESADTSCPIIIVEKDGHFQYILDGHHRLKRALKDNKSCLPAKILRGGLRSESR
jgi:hypothetical protein